MSMVAQPHWASEAERFRTLYELVAALSRSNRACVLSIPRHPGVLFEREVLVDKCDGHAALAYAAGNALDRAMTHVAGSEEPGHARLERQGLATEQTERVAQSGLRKIGVGEDEAATVK